MFNHFFYVAKKYARTLLFAEILMFNHFFYVAKKYARTLLFAEILMFNHFFYGCGTKTTSLLFLAVHGTVAARGLKIEGNAARGMLISKNR